MSMISRWQLVLLMLPTISYASEDDFFSHQVSSHALIKHYLEYNISDIHNIPICYNYSCKTQSSIYLKPDNIKSLHKIFTRLAHNPLGERYAIAQAIASLEKIAAAQTPVYNDKAENYNDNGLPGRMDCIDSAINTSHYLKLINNLGLMRWHEVQEPVYRSPFLMGQHWAAQIKDKTSKQYFAVDSWQSDNGQPPIIQDFVSWKNRASAGKL